MNYLFYVFLNVLLIYLFYKMIRRFTTLLETPYISSNEIITQAVSGKANSFRNTHLESLNWLYSVAPCFPVRGDRVSIIHEPNMFYETLLSKCATAKDRIYLASLYLGTGHLEQKLVTAMKANLETNSQLQVNVLLDFSRGTRGKVNSQTTLTELIRIKDQFCLSLYHTPALRGLKKKMMPPRWNELVGLQHMKLYLFDDTVIISGANLSNDYFTNRQDRYLMVEDKNLADFYSEFIAKVQEFSLRSQPNEEVSLHPKWELLPYHGNQTDFVDEAKSRISTFFQNSLDKQHAIVKANKEADTWIFPLIEMGQLGIHHDSIVTNTLLSSSLEQSKMKFATGYFNLTDEYMETITNNCAAECSVLMAHPTANGFTGAKGPAGSIPTAYTLIARKFHEKLVKAKQDHRVSLLEYAKNGWSYHAKGLWYYLPESLLPSLTLIGSSNFGERSVNRDLETQLCIVTENKSLQTRLQAECDNLYRLGTTAESELAVRPIPRWVRTVVLLFKNFF